MVIETFWTGLPGYRGIQKGRNGVIGYGFTKLKKEASAKNQKRKALRKIRKLGFDESEVWSLDNTIMEWLADTYGGFFKVCGSPDTWNEYDLTGRKVDFWSNRESEDYWKSVMEWEKLRYDSFKNHLKNFLENLGLEDKKKVSDFCSPRLRHLAKITHGWPKGDKYPDFSDWIDSINNMAEEFEKGSYSEDFIEDFFSLWD